MKRRLLNLLSTGLALLFFSIQAAGESTVLELKAGYFSPSEQAFKDIYGGGIEYGAELNFRLRGRWDIWLNGGYFQKKGELSFTKEETTVRIIPVGGGIRYRLTSGTVVFYTGAGISYYMYKETNPIGEASKGAVGYRGRIGLFMHIIESVILDVTVDYTYCRLKPADFRINIGGFTVGVGLGFAF